jgi:hypothetical protein
MHDPGLARRTQAQPAFLEHLQHRGVVGQDIRDQFLEPGCTGNRSEMAHQHRTDTLSLVLVDHGKSDLGLPRLHDDVPSAPHDHRSPAFFRHGDQGNVVDEVDGREERDLLLGKAAFDGKETAVEGLRTGAADGCNELVPVVGLRARISTGRPSRSVSIAEYLAASAMASNPPVIHGTRLALHDPNPAAVFSQATITNVRIIA